LIAQENARFGSVFQFVVAIRTQERVTQASKYS
jgi:hypothetical protein